MLIEAVRVECNKGVEGLIKIVSQKIDNFCTNIERFLVGETWAMKYPFMDRLWYWRTTYRWPQGVEPLFEQIISQIDINQTTNPVCEGVKLNSARKIGLDVQPTGRWPLIY